MSPEARTFRSVAAVLACAFACACDAQPVEFRIVHGSDQDPYVGATDITISLHDRNDETLRSWSFAAPAPRGSLDPLATGHGLRFVVEATAGGRVLARGHSLPFDLGRGLSVPHPDVYLGRLGRFATPLSEPAVTGRPLAIAATSSGAIWIDSIGAIHRFELHDRSAAAVSIGGPTLVTVATLATMADASFAALPDGSLFGIGGSDGGAVLLDSSGSVVASLPASTPELADHRFGAAVAYVGGAIVVAGGASSPGGAPTTSVTRFERVTTSGGTTLVPSPLPQLPTARRGARGVAIDVRGRVDCPCERLALVGGDDAGGPRSRVSVIDPFGIDPTIELDHPAIRRDVTAVAIDDGLLLLAGGRDALLAPVDSVDLLVARVDAIVALSPSLPPLFTPRAGAAGVRLAPGLVLVVGGATTLEVPSSAAELVEFPGNTLATGSLVVPVANPSGVLLPDRTVLVVDDASVGLFVPPREL